jgi:DNA-binding NarL/FixJ family response regulator
MGDVSPERDPIQGGAAVETFMKVFIAEHSSQFRQQLREMLDQVAGIEIVGEAAEFVDASTAIMALAPDVIMLDLHLGNGQGIELLKTIRRNDRTSIVIMLTNFSTLPYLKTCMRAGADHLFDKATQVDEVKRIMQELRPRIAAWSVDLALVSASKSNHELPDSKSRY